MDIGVGLIGTGTIGSGVIEILKNNSELIRKRTGVNIVLKKVCEKNLERAKKLVIDENLLTSDYKEVINGKEIQLVIELIGGYEPARTIIIEALNAKKNVVTANKAVIAKYGKEIFEAAKKNRVRINFEASVCGCIPIIKSIRETYASDNIHSIYGILNGTTNFILTRMEEGMTYENALKKAQELGFAEADPTFDVEGFDAAQKLVILSSLAYNSNVSEKISVFGISKIRKEDIVYARELGYKIKLLAVSKLVNDEIDIRVQPTMIPSKHALANVNEELNAVYIVGNQVKELMFYGRGAGKLPTATVVVSDIIDIAQKQSLDENIFFHNYKLKGEETLLSRFYIRLLLLDKPGVFAKVAKVLGDNNISINAVTQKEEKKEFVPVIAITHKALNKDIQNAIHELKALDIVKEKPFYLMIEDFN